MTIEVVAVKGEGCCGTFHPGEKFSVDDIAPDGLCPFLYHTALPYVEGAKNEAVFNNNSKNSILSQCPNPVAAIDISISRQDEETVVIEYDQKKSECPYYDFKQNVKWEITTKNAPFCQRAYDSIFPYLIAASTNKKLKLLSKEYFTVTCPSYPGYVIFRIEVG